jgi:tape measure domain-containing protein
MADSEIVVSVRTDGVALANSTLRQLGQVGQQAELATNRLTYATNKQAQAFDASSAAMRTMQAIGIVTFLAGTTKAVTDLSDSWTNLTNKLVNANSANERMAVVQQRVFDIAQRTRTDLSATATLYARVERSINQYGYTALQSARVTETVNKAMAVSGATAAEAGAAIVQLSQGLQSGVLRGDEFRSVAEQAPRLLQAMSNSLGVTTGELRKMAGEGKLTSDVVVKAIMASSNAIDVEFARTIPTFSQNMAIAMNNLTKFVGQSESATGATRALGSAFVTLSENAGTIVDIMTVLAVVAGTRVVSSMVQSAIATQQARTANVQLAAQQAATNAVMTSAIGITAQKATADRVAAATALQYARAQATVAAGTANELAAKQALTAATIAHRTAVMGEIAAKQALGVALDSASAAQVRFAGATALAQRALAFLGGPLGIAMLAATAIYQFSQASKQAAVDAQTYAAGAKDLSKELDNMTAAQLRATAVRAEEQLRELTQQMEAASGATAAAAKTMDFYTRQLERRKLSGRDTASAEENLKRATDQHTLAAADLEKAQKRVADTQDLVTNATNRALPAIQKAIQLYRDLQSIGGAIDLGAPMEKFQKAIGDANRDLGVATLKAEGHNKQAYVTSQLYSALGKDAETYAEKIQKVASGSINATNAANDEEKALVALAQARGKEYDQQQKVAAIKKAPAEARRQEAYGEAWDKAYARVEARGATSIDRINAQENEMLRQMNEKADKANASAAEREQARKNVQERFARERLDLVDKYSPENKMVRDHDTALKEINQLDQAGLLKGEELNQARLAVESTYLDEKLRLVKDRAVSDQEEIRGQFDPVIAIANQEAESLAVLTAAHDLKLVEDERYYELRRQIQAQAAADTMQAENAVLLGGIASVSSAADAMANTLDMMGAKGSAAYKAMFALSKGFAIAQATMNLSLAITQALADPTALTPMQKFANMAAVAAAGAGLVQQVMGASMQGMAHDGIDSIPREGTWLLDKGERVVDARTNGDLKNFLSGSGGSSAGGPSGGQTVNQTFNITGNTDAQLQSLLRQAAQDGAQQGYSMVLTDVSGSRGQVSRALGR